MFKRRTNPSSAAGFTLVEVLVVVILLGIAAAMVVPYVASANDLEAVSAARVIAADIQYAQNLAMTSQQDVTVTFVPADNQYYLSSGGYYLVHPINKDNYVIDFDDQQGYDTLKVVSADFVGTAMVTFDSMGSPNQPGVVTIQSGPHVYKVQVGAATGKVTVQRVES